MTSGAPSGTTLLLACSTGSQVAQVHALAPWWSAGRRVWVTPESSISRALLAEERWRPTRGPLAAFAVCARLIRADGPVLVVADTGPFGAAALVAARLARVPSMVLQGIDEPGTGRLARVVTRVADRTLAPWPDVATGPRVEVVGCLLGQNGPAGVGGTR